MSGCVLTRFIDGSIRVEQADPQIIIAADVLNGIQFGDPNPNLTFDGDVLKIHGTNRTVIYRIAEKVPDLHAYYAEWPD